MKLSRRYLALLVCMSTSLAYGQVIPSEQSNMPPLTPPVVTDVLSPYETQYFQQTYVTESLDKRLERLETLLFGEAQKGDVSERQQKILSTLSPSAAPSVDQPQNLQPTRESTAPVAASEPDATDYPAVTRLERTVFGRDFIYDDIQKRLNRLEGKIFHQAYPNLSLSDRMDKLSMRIQSDYNLTTTPAGESDSALQDLPDNPGEFVGSGSDTYTSINALEQHLFSKNFSNELLTERLDRLEKRILGHTETGSVDRRLSHLLQDSMWNAPQSATSSSEPPSVQPRVPQSSNQRLPMVQNGTPGTQPPAPRNIQVGAGMAQNSQYQFSPELINMLPPNMRTQLQTGSQASVVSPGQVYTQTSKSQGFVQGMPGSSVIIQQTTETPVFQTVPISPPVMTYGYQTGTSTLGAPSATPNPGGFYSPAPGLFINPVGTQTYTYSQPYNQMGQPMGNAYVTTPFGYSPDFLGQLNNMEYQAYGQTFPGMTVQARLTRLEGNVLGQNNPGYNDYQRLNNLQRAYQAQTLGKSLGKGTIGKVGRAAGSLLLGVPMSTPSP